MRKVFRVLKGLILLDWKYWKVIYLYLRDILNGVLDIFYFGKFLGGIKKTKALTSIGAEATQSTDYIVLKDIFTKADIQQSDVLVDVGCGKGRVICWWLKNGLKNKIIGVELSNDVAKFTKNLLKKFKNVEIVCGNILANIPAEANVFYLYNPFNSEIMRQFRDLLVQKKDVRNIKIIYFNCLHIDIFESDPHWKVETYDVKYPKLCIDLKLAIIKMI